MLRKLIVVVVLSLVTALFLASGAMAAKLLCVSNQTLHGQESAASCLAKGQDPHRGRRIPSLSLRESADLVAGLT